MNNVYTYVFTLALLSILLLIPDGARVTRHGTSCRDLRGTIIISGIIENRSNCCTEVGPGSYFVNASGCRCYGFE